MELDYSHANQLGPVFFSKRKREIKVTHASLRSVLFIIFKITWKLKWIFLFNLARLGLHLGRPVRFCLRLRLVRLCRRLHCDLLQSAECEQPGKKSFSPFCARIPAIPGTPGGPWIPGTPGGPFTPCGPTLPWTPGGPCWPGGPPGPAGPGEPSLPSLPGGPVPFH